MMVLLTYYVSGHITGLQKRINNVEPQTLYVHCSAHTLNLVVQDSMMTVERSRDFLVLLKSLIVFVRKKQKDNYFLIFYLFFLLFTKKTIDFNDSFFKDC